MATLRSAALARGKEYKGSSKKAPVLLRAESGEKMLDSLQFLEKLAGASIASRIFSLVNSYCVIPRPPGDVQNYPASLMRQLLLCGSANKLLRGATVGCGFEKFPNLVGIISDQDGLDAARIRSYMNQLTSLGGLGYRGALLASRGYCDVCCTWGKPTFFHVLSIGSVCPDCIDRPQHRLLTQTQAVTIGLSPAFRKMSHVRTLDVPRWDLSRIGVLPLQSGESVTVMLEVHVQEALDGARATNRRKLTHAMSEKRPSPPSFVPPALAAEDSRSGGAWQQSKEVIEDIEFGAVGIIRLVTGPISFNYVSIAEHRKRVQKRYDTNRKIPTAARTCRRCHQTWVKGSRKTRATPAPHDARKCCAGHDYVSMALL